MSFSREHIQLKSITINGDVSHEADEEWPHLPILSATHLGNLGLPSPLLLAVRARKRVAIPAGVIDVVIKKR